jgi:PEGA domain-containing protein
MGRWGAAAAGLAVAAVALGGDLPVLDVSVDAEVYPVVSEKIEIRPGLSTSGYPELSARARLTLDSAPRGAEVTLDGLARGPTPLQIEDLALGIHELIVRDSAHAAFRRNLRVLPPR